jgi:hypothetical protein
MLRLTGSRYFSVRLYCGVTGDRGGMMKLSEAQRHVSFVHGSP